MDSNEVRKFYVCYPKTRDFVPHGLKLILSAERIGPVFSGSVLRCKTLI